MPYYSGAERAIAGQPERVLAVMAHPDDADFTVAGTIALWARQGAACVYLLCTDGNKGSADPTMTPERLAPIRRAEQRAALARLGGRDVWCLGYEDGVLEPSLALRRAIAEAIAADLRRYLSWEADHGCGWEPHWLELRFGFEGEEGSLPVFELGEGADRVALRGAVDRVDVGPDGRQAVIRDYKSGSARPEHQGGRWKTDKTLQVALYMLAVRDLLGLEPVAGLYQPLGGGDLRARGVFREGAPLGRECVANDERDPEALGEELEAAAARAVELAARLRAGQITPCPETCSRQGCRYPGICRVS